MPYDPFLARIGSLPLFFSPLMANSTWNFSELIPSLSLERRQPVSVKTFAQCFVPAILSYYLTAVLVLIPRTLVLRLALLPVTLLLAYRSLLRLDFASDLGEWYNFLNQGHALALATLTFRVCIWTFKKEPLRRRRSPQKPNPVSSELGQLLLDASDLVFNLRGIGWDWSHGITLPLERRDITSTPSFLLTTFRWFIANTLAMDCCHYAVQWFAPHTLGSPTGGSVFDASLPLPMRYGRAVLITFVSGFTVYFAINALYHMFAIIGITVFRQSPMQWPPVSDKPYLSTSLNEFWTKRWHQLFRDCFIGFGGKPLMLVIGRVGAILGAFLASGILHDAGTWGMGRGTDVSYISGFFFMNGVGVLLEVLYKKMTGKRVGGFVGWIWAASWLLGWGMLLVDAWGRRGLVGSKFFGNAFRPSFLLFEPLY
ncbi:membrane bound O-acyl transferase family-domain-containing protein [Crepidotus variabilis]|uniref:Membrane bound O-acyl transferase family-domain-containing protein n=1 Tax=Crepidotus variabilis TaxID=179855 RepID=A0A9P6E9L5_9AGAR|nr:membrane bound O-acyl transferase family-domain-containing protein [Crepidotus variabilis]